MQERLASQMEVETLVPEPSSAGVEGVAEEESAPRAPVAEEARVSVPTEARDEGVVGAVMALVVPGSVVPVVQLPDSSEVFEDSRDIDPAATARTANKITEFTSACTEVLDEGTSEGPHHRAIIQSGVPPGVSPRRAGGGGRLAGTDRGRLSDPEPPRSRPGAPSDDRLPD